MKISLSFTESPGMVSKLGVAPTFVVLGGCPLVLLKFVVKVRTHWDLDHHGDVLERERAQSQNTDWPVRIIVVGKGETTRSPRGLVYICERIHRGCALVLTSIELWFLCVNLVWCGFIHLFISTCGCSHISLGTQGSWGPLYYWSTSYFKCWLESVKLCRYKQGNSEPWRRLSGSLTVQEKAGWIKIH